MTSKRRMYALLFILNNKHIVLLFFFSFFFFYCFEARFFATSHILVEFLSQFIHRIFAIDNYAHFFG